MLSWLAPILVFGLVIFVHELGHFLAAKTVGVYAPRFSIGFGPTLWRRRWGETEYVLAALPLGGYVRMASREDEASAFIEGGSEERGARRKAGDPEYDPEAMTPFGPKPVPANRWFESKPLPARLFIMIAGVTMNALLALVVSIGLIASFGRVVVHTRAIGGVRGVPQAAALREQLAVGDSILAVDGTPVALWNDVQRGLLAGHGRTVRLTTQRGEVEIPVGGKGQLTREQLVGALDFFIPPVIDSVIARTPAALAGVQAGDSVVAVGGAPVRSWSELVARVGASPGQPVDLTLVRKGTPTTITVRPESTTVTDPVTGQSSVEGRIGAAHRDVSVRERIGFGEAIVQGWKATWSDAGAVLRVLRGLVTREVPLSQLGGPVTIFRASVDAARRGPQWLFALIAFLSINVAVFNLLPVPILDGGQILLNVVEAAKGRAFSARTREYILRAGLLAIALLFVLVLFNDALGIWRLFG
jgi:regulator of sigma E protease